MRLIAKRIGTLGVLFAVTVSAAPSLRESGAAAEDDIYEAVVRYQIKTWDLVAHSYCVTVRDKNPNATFLKRFDPLPVKKGSACRKKKDRIGGLVLMGVVDKKTGKRSVIFDVGEI